MQNKTFLKPKPDKRLAFSFSKMQTLSSFCQFPQRSSSTSSPNAQTNRQTNGDLLPQTHSKASKDTIPTDSSIKTHHTHHTAIPTNQQRSPSSDPRQRPLLLPPKCMPTNKPPHATLIMLVGDTPSHPTQPSRRYTITPNPACRNWSTKVTNIQI